MAGDGVLDPAPLCRTHGRSGGQCPRPLGTTPLRRRAGELAWRVGRRGKGDSSRDCAPQHADLARSSLL